MKIQDDQLVFDTGKVLDRMFKNPGLDLDWQDTGEPLECTLGPDDFFHKNGPEHNASRPFFNSAAFATSSIWPRFSPGPLCQTVSDSLRKIHFRIKTKVPLAAARPGRSFRRTGCQDVQAANRANPEGKMVAIVPTGA